MQKTEFPMKLRWIENMQIGGWKIEENKERRLAITPWTWDNTFLDDHSIPKCQTLPIALQASFSDKMTKLSHSLFANQPPLFCPKTKDKGNEVRAILRRLQGQCGN